MRPIAMTACLLGCIAVPGLASPLSDLDKEICSLDRLTAEYLSCERRALSGPLGLGEAAQCSVLYEALKARRFNGSAAALRAWYAGLGSVAKAADVLPRGPACAMARL